MTQYGMGIMGRKMNQSNFVALPCLIAIWNESRVGEGEVAGFSAKC